MIRKTEIKNEILGHMNATYMHLVINAAELYFKWEIYKYSDSEEKPEIYKTWNELFINMAFQMTNMERLADMANIKYDKEVENIVDEKTGKKFTYTVMKIK